MKRSVGPEWTWLDHRNATIPRRRDTLERLRRPSRFVPSSFVSSARREPVRADLANGKFHPILTQLVAIRIGLDFLVDSTTTASTNSLFPF